MLLRDSIIFHEILKIIQSDENNTLDRLCGIVHQMFVRSPTCLRLVHFQGYDISLIPILVERVDSLHICIDMIDDLLFSNHVFGIHLGVNLCKKYPLPKTHALAEKLLIFLDQIATATTLVQSGSQPFETLIKSVPTLVTLASTFDMPLMERIVLYLIDLLKKCGLSSRGKELRPVVLDALACINREHM